MFYKIFKKHPLLIMVYIVATFMLAALFSPLMAKAEEDNPLNSGDSLSLAEVLYLTLKYQQEIEIAKLNVSLQRGVVQQTKGPFDVQLNSSLAHTYTQNPQFLSIGVKAVGQMAHETITHAEVSKKARLGTLFSVVVDAEQDHNPLNVAAGIAPKNRFNTAIIAFRVDQPLLQGFIHGADATMERASHLELKAVYWEMLYTISQKILTSISSYWDWVAAKKELIIRKQSEERFIELIKMTQKLIENNEAAATDLNQPQAQLAIERRNRFRAEQNVYIAMTDLKFAMGVTEDIGQEIDNLTLEDDFSDIDNELALLKKHAVLFESYAQEHRYDILAAVTREFEAGVLLQGALNGELPKLNLFGAVTKRDFKLGSQAKGLYSSLNMCDAQVDMTVGMQFSMPLQNNAAEGIVRQQRAILQRTISMKTLLMQSALKDLREAIRNQISLSNQLKEANLAVDKYQTLVINENKKLRTGNSTVFVLVDYEISLTTSLSNRVLVHKQYMQNIALIRQLTATFLAVDDCSWEIVLQNPTKLPFDVIL